MIFLSTEDLTLEVSEQRVDLELISLDSISRTEVAVITKRRVRVFCHGQQVFHQNFTHTILAGQFCTHQRKFYIVTAQRIIYSLSLDGSSQVLYELPDLSARFKLEETPRMLMLDFSRTLVFIRIFESCSHVLPILANPSPPIEVNQECLTSFNDKDLLVNYRQYIERPNALQLQIINIFSSQITIYRLNNPRKGFVCQVFCREEIDATTFSVAIGMNVKEEALIMVARLGKETQILYTHSTEQPMLNMIVIDASSFFLRSYNSVDAYLYNQLSLKKTRTKPEPLREHTVSRRSLLLSFQHNYPKSSKEKGEKTEKSQIVLSIVRALPETYSYFKILQQLGISEGISTVIIGLL